MHKTFADHIEKRRREYQEWQDAALFKLGCFKSLLALLAEHKHYKLVDKRIIDKYQGPARLMITTDYLKGIKFYWHDDKGHYHEERIVTYDEPKTPALLTQKLEAAIKSYESHLLSIPDFKKMSDFFEDLSKLVGDDTDKKSWLGYERWHL